MENSKHSRMILLAIYQSLHNKRLTYLSIKKIKQRSKDFEFVLHALNHPVTADPTLITKPIDMQALLNIQETATLSDEIEARVFGTPLKIKTPKKKITKAKKSDPTVINRLENDVKNSFLIAAKRYAEIMQAFIFALKLEVSFRKLERIKQIERELRLNVFRKLARGDENTTKSLQRIAARLQEILLALYKYAVIQR